MFYYPKIKLIKFVDMGKVLFLLIKIFVFFLLFLNIFRTPLESANLCLYKNDDGSIKILFKKARLCLDFKCYAEMENLCKEFGFELLPNDSSAEIIVKVYKAKSSEAKQNYQKYLKMKSKSSFMKKISNLCCCCKPQAKTSEPIDRNFFYDEVDSRLRYLDIMSELNLSLVLLAFDSWRNIQRHADSLDHKPTESPAATEPGELFFYSLTPSYISANNSLSQSSCPNTPSNCRLKKVVFGQAEGLSDGRFNYRKTIVSPKYKWTPMPTGAYIFVFLSVIEKISDQLSGKTTLSSHQADIFCGELSMFPLETLSEELVELLIKVEFLIKSLVNIS